MVDKSEGKGVCITNQPHLMLTLFFSEFTKEEKMGREKERCEGWGGGRLDNRTWGEAGFVTLELNNMVAGWSWSNKTSSDWLRDPTFSPKATVGQQGHSPLTSLGLWIRTRPRHWNPQHSLALELEHLSVKPDQWGKGKRLLKLRIRNLKFSYLN